MTIKCIECGDKCLASNQNQVVSFTMHHIHGRKIPTLADKKIDPWFIVVK